MTGDVVRKETAVEALSDRDLVAELRRRGRLLSVGAVEQVETWAVETPGYEKHLCEVLAGRVAREIVATVPLREFGIGHGEGREVSEARLEMVVLTVRPQ